MAKNKLRRFEEMKEMPHVFEPSMEEVKKDGVDFKHKWRSTIFKNNNSVVLELGCGKGEYSIGLARKYPEKNFIGVDIKGARMWVGAKQAVKENLSNVKFLRTKVDFIEKLFGEDEVDEIWLTFSDPQPNKPNKRLTSSVFIERYRKLLKKGGLIHLKTDSDILFEFTKDEISQQNYKLNFLTWDLYKNLNRFPDHLRDTLQIKTHYEMLFSEKGAVIKYCQFSI